MNPKAFQKKVLNWYKKNQRDLPWRKTTNPYHILVSEIMLQQTQVDRVIPYYEKWLQSFPDCKSLAKADKKTVLTYWSGLGYNNRALRLQQLAFIIKDKPFPETEEALLELPGIGPYTARAVLAFAFNKPVPVIDTNIRRVLIAELNLKEDTDMKTLENFALQCIPKDKSCIWHNALMDYGALYLTAKKTNISPLSKQSSFKGSDRQVRGYIIKELLKTKKLQLEKVQTQFPKKNLTPILEKMKKDGLINTTKTTISLA